MVIRLRSVLVPLAVVGALFGSTGVALADGGAATEEMTAPTTPVTSAPSPSTNQSTTTSPTGTITGQVAGNPAGCPTCSKSYRVTVPANTPTVLTLTQQPGPCLQAADDNHRNGVLVMRWLNSGQSPAPTASQSAACQQTLIVQSSSNQPVLIEVSNWDPTNHTATYTITSSAASTTIQAL